MAVVGSQLISLEGRGQSNAASPALTAGQVGLWAFLATVSMLFAGFTSAILVRQTAPDWRPLPVPSLLWVNTALLVSSSITLERARRLARQGRWSGMRSWLILTALLGLFFLAGQLAAWRQFVGQGLYLASSPHSSFFYILTGTHGAHLLGGLFALGYLLTRSLPPPAGAARRMSLCATYWHFLDVLWIYLFVVLFVV